MKISNSYSQEFLKAVGKSAAGWDERFFTQGVTKHEVVLRKEFRLLLQYLFIKEDPNPLNPQRENLEKWLTLAEGFDIHEVRIAVIKRLKELLDSKEKSALKLSYPDWKHLLFWRLYH